MRYEIDENNYIAAVYFNCNSGTCTEYTGNIPDGYTSLEEWASNANIQAYKVVDGNLVYDSVRDSELQTQWATEEENNKPELKGNKVTSIDSTNTDTQYPSAKAVYDAIQTIEPTSGGSNINYSTSEQLIGTWINGKPLYRKTITFSATSSGTGSVFTYTHNIKNVDNIFIDWGNSYKYSSTNTIYKNSAGETFGIGAGSGEFVPDYSSGITGIDNTVIKYRQDGSTSLKTYVVTVKYTKTTD